MFGINTLNFKRAMIGLALALGLSAPAAAATISVVPQLEAPGVVTQGEVANFRLVFDPITFPRSGVNAAVFNLRDLKLDLGNGRVLTFPGSQIAGNYVNGQAKVRVIEFSTVFDTPGTFNAVLTGVADTETLESGRPFPTFGVATFTESFQIEVLGAPISEVPLPAGLPLLLGGLGGLALLRRKRATA